MATYFLAVSPMRLVMSFLILPFGYEAIPALICGHQTERGSAGAHVAFARGAGPSTEPHVTPTLPRSHVTQSAFCFCSRYVTRLVEAA